MMPFLGDIRTKPGCNYQPHTPLSQTTEFEIWDGSRWVDAQAAANREMVVEIISKKVITVITNPVA